MSLLHLIRGRTELVAESADPSIAKSFGARHVSLSASKINAAAQLAEHDAIVNRAVRWAQREIGKGGNRRMVGARAVERLGLEFALALLEVIDGDVVLEVDGRLAYKRRSLIERARTLWAELDERGADLGRVLLKFPATWEGIEAVAKVTDKNGIRCQVDLVFGLHQVAAAAAAGATVISPAVGRISDFHRKRDGVDGYPPEEDPGVQAVREMRAYVATHHPDVLLAPGTFRGLEQAVALYEEADRLLLPPKLLQLLEGSTADLPPPSGPVAAPKALELDAATFHALHRDDEVAHAKLAASVQNLNWAIKSQEKQLTEWIESRQDRAAERSTLSLFEIWDYDGDGFIDREEWGGSEAVFNALDINHDGRISLEEMAIGLGAPAPERDD